MLVEYSFFDFRWTAKAAVTVLSEPILAGRTAPLDLRWLKNAH
jgi:hypothetical protein